MPFYEYRRLTPQQQRDIVATRVARGFPPHSPPHPEQGAGYYHLTAPIYEHAPVISTAERRTAFAQSLVTTFTHDEIEIVAWVVLPNHYHMYVWLPMLAVAAPLLKGLHGRTSHQWNREDGQRGRKVWYHYADRATRSEEQFYRTINYIHANPVRHGYVQHSRAWPWSSLHTYADTLGMDWLASMWRRYPIGDNDKEWDD